MRIHTQTIRQFNKQEHDAHHKKLSALQASKEAPQLLESIIQKLAALQIAIPSWALGTGGTRFGRFAGGGEPRSLEEKLEDIGLLHALNANSGAVSLHIPWDIPENYQAIKSLADELNIKFDAVNSNTFQDQKQQEHSYKFGSLAHSEMQVRKQAVKHNIEVIEHGEALGSKSMTVWLADGSNFPGQQNFRKAFERTLDSLQQIYAALPDDWKLFVEYKPYEPNFYSTVIQDWGSSLLLASKLGSKAYSLVDLGHHLPNTNIEQIVSRLMMEGKLGGFHFNDSKYGDDDLTVGSIKPYQLYLIFLELAEGMEQHDFAWMIDASHNVKDPLEDLLQSVEAILIAYAQALLVDKEALEQARDANDVALCQEIIQDAYRTDVRPLLAEARLRKDAALYPIRLFRELKVRAQLIESRGRETVATGL
ncbi:L-rhamnose isomerase/sugar isomerase [Catalinimonas alkaloidigena]|uniref:TIM barrel protein n=1 Tax=Catalinimonas alkaloidigena TaxID=1075417 RepID=UPI00240592C8|nr:TIM barrel protein [Catalinimonas alkaloidigena]MDF9801149.1 L-rhamnose isomerase/sugar isomerase [Catalinimonas alkaloidigena]